MLDNNLKNVQNKILFIMKFIDRICRDNGISYFIMGGTALGAVRHKGFIPWDDDLDIFMTSIEYNRFKEAFYRENSELFVLQEWRISKKYLEYAKVRLNGTTFIEEVYKNKKNMHHGIYVDIMILHKVPNNIFIQKKVYLYSKFVTVVALSQRNWKPKNLFQKIVLQIVKIIPKKLLVRIAYHTIYKYDRLENNFKWCYWITPAKFRNGLFEKNYFEEAVDIKFEDTYLLASKYICEYLKYRYGDYMQLPSEKERKQKIHAYIYDVNNDYTNYFK